MLSGLRKHQLWTCAAASLLYCCSVIYKAAKGSCVLLTDFSKRLFPPLLYWSSAGMLDMFWRQEVPLFLPWLRVHLSMS